MVIYIYTYTYKCIYIIIINRIKSHIYTDSTSIKKDKSLNFMEESCLLDKIKDTLQYTIPPQNGHYPRASLICISKEIISQLTKTGTLDQQVSHSQGDQAIITEGLMVAGHQETMGQTSMSYTKTTKNNLPISRHYRVLPRLYRTCDFLHLVWSYSIPMCLPKVLNIGSNIWNKISVGQ